MDYLKKIDEKVVAQVDNIKFDDMTDELFNEMNRKSKLVTIDWNNILPEPPANSSDITKKELDLIEKLTSSVTQKQMELIMKVDANPANVFLPILNDQELPFPRKLYNECLYQLDPILLKLKYKYKRARPFQLAGVYNKTIKVINTSSHQTPAYPSGHVAQAGLCAALLSWIYPDLSSKFYGAVESVGMARMLQGVHYPSDNDAGMLLGSAIWEDIKYKIKAPNFDHFSGE